VFGGSWGSTLGLAYAEHHPERCLGSCCAAFSSAAESEIDWFLYGLRAIFPEAWRTFSGYVPEGERGDLLDAFHKRLVHPDPAVHMPAARCWSVYEGSCSTLLPNPALVADFASDRVALGLARIEAHYFRHDIFLPTTSC
jgi:proline iminopeptidase